MDLSGVQSFLNHRSSFAGPKWTENRRPLIDGAHFLLGLITEWKCMARCLTEVLHAQLKTSPVLDRRTILQHGEATGCLPVRSRPTVLLVPDFSAHMRGTKVVGEILKKIKERRLKWYWDVMGRKEY